MRAYICISRDYHVFIAHVFVGRRNLIDLWGGSHKAFVVAHGFRNAVGRGGWLSPGPARPVSPWRREHRGQSAPHSRRPSPDLGPGAPTQSARPDWPVGHEGLKVMLVLRPIVPGLHVLLLCPGCWACNELQSPFTHDYSMWHWSDATRRHINYWQSAMVTCHFSLRTFSNETLKSQLMIEVAFQLVRVVSWLLKPSELSNRPNSRCVGVGLLFSVDHVSEGWIGLQWHVKWHKGWKVFHVENPNPNQR